MTEYQAYPLAWPAHWKRAAWRKDANFHRKVDTGQGWKKNERVTVEQAQSKLHSELRQLGAKKVVVSSNLRLRLDGLPYSNQNNPSDPGVCVYFELNGRPRCLPCDQWKRAADNLVAIAKYVEAMRGQIRWGVGSVDAMFAGFKALPGGDAIVTPPAMSVEEAAQFVADAIGHPVSKPTIIESEPTFAMYYRSAAKRLHPDANGGVTSNDWLTLQQAGEVLKRHHGV